MDWFKSRPKEWTAKVEVEWTQGITPKLQSIRLSKQNL